MATSRLTLDWLPILIRELGNQGFDAGARFTQPLGELLVGILQCDHLLAQAEILLPRLLIVIKQLGELAFEGIQFILHVGTIICGILLSQPGNLILVEKRNSITLESLVYCGRFAPTPSGALHFGSLIAALASYLDARAHEGTWLLRIEDVDPPRVADGASASILKTLAAHGFGWDGEVMYQSARAEAYQHALSRLIDAGRVYACGCSRKLIAALGCMGVDGPVYPGTCRLRSAQEAGAMRLRLIEQRVVFQDGVLGRVACDVEQECGDFVLRRADGVYSYQLAVVVDDAAQGVTHVVRGADLLASTPRQIVLQQALGYRIPVYTHLPVVLDAQGQKLSKQTLAAPLHDAEPLPALSRAGAFLGLPKIAPVGNAEDWLQVATRLWSEAVPPRIRGRHLQRESSCCGQARKY